MRSFRASGTFTYLDSSAPEGQNIYRKRKYVKETVRAIRFFKAKTFFRTEQHRPSIMRDFDVGILRIFINQYYNHEVNQVFSKL